MKKIFAFILATIMVLSIVPASAFAAVTNCPKKHTLDNCEATEVKTVDATCTTRGYTLYACDACGVQFAADIVDSIGHVFESDANTTYKQDVDPVCAAKGSDCKDGIRYVKCIVCNKSFTLYGDPTKANGSTKLYDPSLSWENWFHSLESEHNTLTYDSGEGCMAAYKCSCGRKVNGEAWDGDGSGYNRAGDKTVPASQKTGSHRGWEYSYTEKAPVWDGEDGENGMAIYACVKCGDTKGITILALHSECVYELVSEAVDNNCTDDGQYAIYVCKVCGLLYMDVEGDGDPEDMVYIESEEDAIIPARGHKLEDEDDIDFNGSRDCTKTGICEYSDCRMEVTVECHPDDSLEVVYNQPATCTKWGYTTWVCTRCGDYYTETSDKAPVGHDEVTVIVEANCTTYGYTYKYCTNEYCDYSWDEDAEEFELTTSVTKRGMTFPLYPYDEEGELDLDWDEGVNLVPNSFAVLNKDTGAHLYNYKVLSEKSCDTDYLAIMTCAICGAIDVKHEASTGHTPGEYPENVQPTPEEPALCLDPGVYYYWCTVCEEQVAVEIPAYDEHIEYVWKSWHNCEEGFLNPDDNKYYHTKQYITCLCKGEDDADPEYIRWADEVGKSSVKVNFTGDNADYADAIHYGYINWNPDGTVNYIYSTSPDNLVNPISSKEPTCITNGTEVYECTKCDRSVVVTLNKTAHNAHLSVDEENDLFVAGKYIVHDEDQTTGLFLKSGDVTNCAKDVVEGYYICQTCGVLYQYVENENGELEQVKTTTSKIKLGKHPNKEKIKAENPCTHVDYYWCPDCERGSLKSDMSKPFTESQIDSKTERDSVAHSWDYLVKVTKVNCADDGVVGAKVCKNCDLLVIEYQTAYSNKDYATKDKADANDDDIYDPEHPYVVNIPDSEHNHTVEIKNFDKEKYMNADFQGINVLKYQNSGWVTVSVDNFEHKVGDTSKLSIDTEDSHMHDETCVNYDHRQYQHVTCTLCKYEFLQNFFEGCTEHVNANGDVLDFTCENYNAIPDDDDRYCVNCWNFIAPAHKKAYDTVEATCVKVGHTFEYCTNPGCTYEKVTAYEEIAEDIEDRNHKYNDDYSVLSDYATVGYLFKFCELCDYIAVDRPDEPVSGKGIEIYIDAELDNYTVGSYVDVVVSLASLQATDVWGVEFTVDYDNNALKYVGYEFAEGTSFNIYTVNDTTVREQIDEEWVDDPDSDDPNDGWFEPVYESDKLVKIAASNENGVDIKDEEALVTLTFKVVEAIGENGMSKAGFFVKNAKAVSSTKKNVLCNYYAGTMFEADANKDTIVLQDFLELDGIDGVTISDALVLYTMIVYDEYDVLADVNADGKLDLVDLGLFYDLLTGKITVEDILNPDEETDRIKEYDANGDIIYDSYCDFNKNGVMDSVLEMSCMYGKIDPAVIWAGMAD